MVHPIIDDYYSYNPYHRRSSKYVQDKGLVTNEKGVPLRLPGLNSITPGTPLQNRTNTNLKLPPPTTKSSKLAHDSIASTLVPSILGSAFISPLVSSLPATKKDGIVTVADENIQPSFRPQDEQNTRKRTTSTRTAGDFESIESPDTPPRPTTEAFGDPNKIAQYFPELDTGF